MLRPTERACSARSTARALASAIAIVVGLSTGCASSPPDAPTATKLEAGTSRVTTSGQTTLEVRSEPIKLGKNDLSVTVLTEGAELVGVSALMPAHGHGTRPPVVEKDGAGTTWRIRDLILYMSGRWELHLSVSSRGTKDDVVLLVDVP